ncbi:hypothetical protein ABZ897_08570 [Nonomuraea sp. NPDC046802]|uniref:hypothetical protein n=1 Tax=Nonomuraea sp. NPDC046802 TaxID=3154919 RepID=UPI0033C60784
MSERTFEVRLCGRPTRSGSPCKQRVYGSDVACGIHITDHERALSEAYQRGWREGHSSGYDSGRSMTRQEIERLQRRVAELEQQLDDAQRYYEINGDQVVEVGKYAYRWRGQPALKVGERVLLPENWVSQMTEGRGTFVGEVTRLGATYRGHLSAIVGRAETDQS